MLTAATSAWTLGGLSGAAPETEGAQNCTFAEARSTFISKIRIAAVAARAVTTARTIGLYVSEILGWQPTYQLSVNRSRFDDGACSEITLLSVKTVCRYPEKLAGRTTEFSPLRRARDPGA